MDIWDNIKVSMMLQWVYDLMVRINTDNHHGAQQLHAPEAGESESSGWES